MPLTSSVGVPAIEKQPGKAQKGRNQQKRRHGLIRKPGEPLHEGWYPIDGSEGPRERKEESGNQYQNSPVVERSHNRVISKLLFRFEFGVQFVDEPVSLVLRKPTRLRRPIRHIEVGDDPHDNRRKSLQDKEPTPSRQGLPMHTEEPAGQGRANQSGGGVCCV